MAGKSKPDRANDAADATADYLKAQQDLLSRTARLREIRLAHQAQFGPQQKPALRSPKTVPASRRTSGSLLNNWVLSRTTGS